MKIEIAIEGPLETVPARQHRLPKRPGQLDQGVGGVTRVGAALVVGADGARSAVRALCGIAERRWDTRQQAIVATIETAGPHQRTAWQRFLQSGPLALLLIHGFPLDGRMWRGQVAALSAQAHVIVPDRGWGLGSGEVLGMMKQGIIDELDANGIKQR